MTKPQQVLVQHLAKAITESHHIDMSQYRAKVEADDITCEVSFTCRKGGKIIFSSIYWNEETGEPLQYEVGLDI